MKLDHEELKHVASILMGAAHADGDYDGHEAEAIGDILHELLGQDQLPEDLADHLAAFHPDTFDLQASCAALGLQTRTDRTTLLALVDRVTEADTVHSIAESDYIERVGQAIGARPEEYDDLTVDVLELTGPPPLPPEA